MAEPALSNVRMVAATLPGHGGTPPPTEFSIEYAARLAAQLAADTEAGIVVGFSMGATVALEMVMSGAFSRPVVLLGISLSLQDEPVFLRALDRFGVVMGSLPFAAMRAMFGSLTKHVRVSEERRADLLEDLRMNDPSAMRQIFRGYVQYLRRDGAPAARLCSAGVPAWIVHSEKGDGGLTADERHTLESCSTTTVVTIPGTSFFLPSEHPERIAKLVVEAFDSLDGRGREPDGP
jgi:pimeloyl-ACP methyl ester carboxylesterase